MVVGAYQYMLKITKGSFKNENAMREGEKC